MLKLKEVTKTFGRIKALDNLSFELEDGEFVFVMGPSGSGKTTLIRLILREILPDSGEIVLDGEDLTKVEEKVIPKIRQQIGVVFQDFKVLPERTLRENIEVALAVTKVPQDEWKGRVDHVLKLVGLQDRSDLFPSQLSGGELQRASLARALVINPKVLLADEPTGNLDWDTAEAIVDLFSKVNKEGKTVLVATHNKDTVRKFKHRIVEIQEGRLVKDTAKKKSEKEAPQSEKESKEHELKPEKLPDQTEDDTVKTDSLSKEKSKHSSE
jgi:cell division transport system ATP-binding protein